MDFLCIDCSFLYVCIKSTHASVHMVHCPSCIVASLCGEHFVPLLSPSLSSSLSLAYSYDVWSPWIGPLLAF